jgi:serine-type D-Ala-D-Ala carboxypeptidase (penicillin-binding protein 5/6)
MPKKLSPVLMNILIMTMKQILRTPLFFGLVSMLVAVQPAAQAATKKSTTAAAPASTTKTTKSASVAQSPYLGAIIVDAVTGKVLFDDHADAKGYPASVLKLMDLLIILEKIEQHQLSLQDQVVVSAKASKTGGSQVYLAEKESFTVDEMLYALMVQSANDAAVALAEKVGGTTDGFLELMNQRAKLLGMTNTVFHSVHGLPPSAGQEHDVTSARDLSLLCRELLKHSDTLRYTSTRARPFRPGPKVIEMTTHNHLMASVEGCDGLKTGYITQAGYSIAVTAARQSRRIIVVVLDSIDLKTRDSKATELVAKGFALFPPAPAATTAVPAKK